MDDRVRAHAETLVDWSARVEPGDLVTVSVAEGAHDLAVAVAAALGERDATPVFTYDSAEVTRAFVRAGDDDAADAGTAGDDAADTARDGRTFRDPVHERALLDATDVYLRLGGGRNTAATADVPGDRRAARARARQATREARFDTRWVSTVHPTRSLAQAAGMSFEAYREFAYGAILRDWASLAEEMQRLKARLDAGSDVHLVAPGTDLRLSIEGRTAVNSAASVAYDSHNLPSGEVFTAPADADGEVTFTVPSTVDGRRLRDVRLTFADGVVVDHDAAEGADVVADLLATDAGARRLGELGVGMNRGVDRFTDNVLFDEKMGDTVHLALGRAYDACIPDGESGTESAIHVDMIVDVSEDAAVTVDGETVQRNGRFRWEEGFEADGDGDAAAGSAPDGDTDGGA
jgi:aminopeptidase